MLKINFVDARGQKSVIVAGETLSDKILLGLENGQMLLSRNRVKWLITQLLFWLNDGKRFYDRTQKMTTREIELAVMNYFINTRRSRVVVPNVSWGVPGLHHECDVVAISGSNYGTEIEIKATLSDLKKEREKKHNHESRWIKYLYYAIPAEMYSAATDYLPEHAGVILVWRDGNPDGVYGIDYSLGLQVIRQPEANATAVKWSEKDVTNLMRLGALRIAGLKKNLLQTTQFNIKSLSK